MSFLSVISGCPQSGIPLYVHNVKTWNKAGNPLSAWRESNPWAQFRTRIGCYNHLGYTELGKQGKSLGLEWAGTTNLANRRRQNMILSVFKCLHLINTLNTQKNSLICGPVLIFSPYLKYVPPPTVFILLVIWQPNPGTNFLINTALPLISTPFANKFCPIIILHKSLSISFYSFLYH